MRFSSSKCTKMHLWSGLFSDPNSADPLAASTTQAWSSDSSYAWLCCWASQMFVCLYVLDSHGVWNQNKTPFVSLATGLQNEKTKPIRTRNTAIPIDLTFTDKPRLEKMCNWLSLSPPPYSYFPSLPPQNPAGSIVISCARHSKSLVCTAEKMSWTLIDQLAQLTGRLPTKQHSNLPLTRNLWRLPNQWRTTSVGVKINNFNQHYTTPLRPIMESTDSQTMQTKKTESAHHKLRHRLLGATWKDKVRNEDIRN